MNLLIISSSQRINSQSAKVAQFIADNTLDFHSINLLDLCRYNLPFWDGEDESKNIKGSSWPLISEKVRRADALVLITPEWGGMASPLLKNFLLMCDSQDTAHKPALLVSVVSGISGAYPIAELRMNALKNNKLVAMPDHLIIRNVVQVLNQQDKDEINSPELRNDNKHELNLINRISYNLHMLHQYSGALKQVRLEHQDKPFPKQQEYAYGM